MADQRSPWLFRARAYVSGFIFLVGFYVGFSIDPLMGGSGEPTYRLIGQRLGPDGVRIAAIVAFGLTFAGFLIRWWGSSYHRAGVVYSNRIETASLTAAGPYRFTRNPLYFGNVLQAIAISSLGPPPATILIIAGMVALVYALIFLEERSLRADQGASYDAYSEVVPRLLPRLSSRGLPASAQRPNILYGFATELGTFGLSIWMGYVALFKPRGPTTTFYLLLYGALVLFIIGGALSRRMTAQSDSRSTTS
jgi:protein-S-isoprenylcysteine O-methyltransferase Ste14